MGCTIDSAIHTIHVNGCKIKDLFIDTERGNLYIFQVQFFQKLKTSTKEMDV
jgi:hypothetical protein